VRVYLVNPLDIADEFPVIFSNEACFTMFYDLGGRAPVKSYDRGPAGHCFYHDEAERLLPAYGECMHGDEISTTSKPDLFKKLFVSQPPPNCDEWSFTPLAYLLARDIVYFGG